MPSSFESMLAALRVAITEIGSFRVYEAPMPGGCGVISGLGPATQEIAFVKGSCVQFTASGGDALIAFNADVQNSSNAYLLLSGQSVAFMLRGVNGSATRVQVKAGPAAGGSLYFASLEG